MSTELIAVALGLLVGLSLGALGGGGSTLAVPVLVFVAGLEAQSATSASLLVVGIAAAVGVVGHWRNGNVRLGAGLAFGAAGVVGSRLGLLVNRAVDGQVLLLAFSVLILYVAQRMYRSATAPAPARTQAQTRELAMAGRPAPASPPVAAAERDEATRRAGSRRRPIDLSPAAVARLALAATAVGFLTGLFGVGGGFAVVPALTLLLGFPTKEAIGTSLVVIVVNAAMALAMRAGDLDMDWTVVGPFLATVSLGVVAGTGVAHRVDARRLTRAFAVMLAIVALYTAASTLLGA